MTVSLWTARKIKIRGARSLREINAETFCGIFAVHKELLMNGRYSKRIIGTTHMPSGLSMRYAIGVYYEIAEAKEALEIASRVQNDWIINCDLGQEELTKIQKRVMAAVADYFGTVPFDRLKEWRSPGRPSDPLWLNASV